MPLRALFLMLFIMFAAVAAPACAQSSGGSGAYFKVDAIDEGLGPRPDGIVLETPQSMMESFLGAAGREDWKAAAHVLDLAHLEPSEQEKWGPVLARDLYQVIQRGMWLDWTALPDRPDALEANVSRKDPMAGEPRRSISLAILDLPRRPVSIRIARLKTPDGDPVWMFSRQTVGNIVAMHEIYGPTQLERSLPKFLQKRAFLTLTWWEVLALPLVMLAALFAATAAYRGSAVLSRRQPSQVMSRVIEAIRLPLALMVFVGTFTLSEALLFTFSGMVNALLTPFETVLFVIALALIAVRIVDAVLERVVQHNMAELEGSEFGRRARSLHQHLGGAAGGHRRGLPAQRGAHPDPGQRLPDPRLLAARLGRRHRPDPRLRGAQRARRHHGEPADRAGQDRADRRRGPL